MFKSKKQKFRSFPFFSGQAEAPLPFEYWLCKDGALNGDMIKGFSAWGLNLASTLPEDEGASGTYYLCASPVGRALLIECPELCAMIEPEALNRMITAEGPDQGKTGVYWLCSTQDGQELLGLYPELRAMISVAGFNRKVIGEGPDQGKTPVYRLSETTYGQALFLGYLDLVGKVNVVGMNAGVTAVGPDYGKTAAYNFCAMPTGRVLLRSPVHQHLSRLIHASTLNRMVEGDERDGPMSAAAHLIDTETGLQILYTNSRFVNMVDVCGLSKEQRDDFAVYQGSNKSITVAKYLKSMFQVLRDLSRLIKLGFDLNEANCDIFINLVMEKQQSAALCMLKFWLNNGLLQQMLSEHLDATQLFCRAIAGGLNRVAKFLLEHYTVPSELDSTSLRGLSYALELVIKRYGRATDQFAMLVVWGADFDRELVNWFGGVGYKSPLQLAIEQLDMNIMKTLLVAGARKGLNEALHLALSHYALSGLDDTMLLFVVGAQTEAGELEVHPVVKPYYDLIIAMDDLGIDRREICDQRVAGDLSPGWMSEMGLKETLIEKTGQPTEVVERFLKVYSLALEKFVQCCHDFLAKKEALVTARSAGTRHGASVRSGAAILSDASGPAGAAGNNALLWHKLMIDRKNNRGYAITEILPDSGQVEAKRHR